MHCELLFVVLAATLVGAQSCAPIQWTQSSEAPGFSVVSETIQISCTTYLQQNYYVINGSPTPPLSQRYWNVGFANSFQWAANTYVDPKNDPLIDSAERWTWSADQQRLIVDSSSSRLGSDGSTSYSSGTSVYSIHNQTTILLQSATVSRSNADTPIAGESSTFYKRYIPPQ